MTSQRGRRLVRIAYFDEAGTASEAQEPFVVYASVLIDGDREWHPVEYLSSEIVKTLVPLELRDTFEFHAKDLFQGSEKFQGKISRDLRSEIFHQFLNIIAQFKLPISYGAITRSKMADILAEWTPAERVQLAQQYAFDLCVAGLQGWFLRETQGEVAICIADRNDPLRPSLKKGFASLRKFGLPGNPFLALFSFVDALHFADSEESIGLQLADSAAFLIKRHLMGKTDSAPFFDQIKDRIVCDPKSALWPMD